jgi:hypothetical protein
MVTLAWILGLLGIGGGALSFFGIGLALPFIGPFLAAAAPIVQMVVGWITSLLTLIFNSFIAILKAPETWVAVGVLGVGIYLGGLWEGKRAERTEWQARWDARDRAVEKNVAERVAAAERAKQAVIAEQEADADALRQQITRMETESNALKSKLDAAGQGSGCDYRPGELDGLRTLGR